MKRTLRGLLVLAALLCVWALLRWWLPALLRPEPERRVIVTEPPMVEMRPLIVREPQQQRWRDVAGVAYDEAFRQSFAYGSPGHAARIRCRAEGQTLHGTIIARGLKPWFAYQLKLVGAAPLRGTSEEDNTGDSATWSSWRLGRLGRWWCEDCQWNVLDEDLAEHLSEGHDVRGYVLFDWFVTDANGDAEQDFVIDTSLHVLWREEQRDRGRHDTAVRPYELRRGDYGYGPDAPDVECVGIYGEWEPDRPRPGRVRLPAGQYQVRLNLTEESFHANMDDERMLEGGGFWAWVLEADVSFAVKPIPTRASRPGCIPGSHEGAGLLWRLFRRPT
ncbi:MAG: hypothetical protein U9R79_18345 [Armatimonadota bacterium]|nr:hypothetical protein [Armatimonadota bacterium]